MRSDVAANPPPSCTQQSVTIPPRLGQVCPTLIYGSPEWKATYNLLRSANEGMNGFVKDPAREALDDPGRRRLHGVAAQSVLVALLLLAANVRKIRAFLQGALLARTGTVRRRPRRRRTSSVANWRPTSPSAASAAGPDPPLIA